MLIDNFKKCVDCIEKNYSHIFLEYKIIELLILLDKKTVMKIHSYKLNELSIIYEQILRKYGENSFEELRKLVILKCVLNSWGEIFSDKYTENIQIQFKRNLKRFLEICTRPKGWGDYSDDVYWKDLAIARQQMFPAGAQVVEAYSGFSLRQGLAVNILQSMKFLSLIFKSYGKNGFYQIHTHTPELAEFSEQGWNRCYIRIADMLKINNNIKGMFGSSWFYDPQLETVSPRLMYLQKIPLNNGAKAFHIGEDKSGNAIAKSKTRRNLYNEGKYIPQSYLLIWPRKDLLHWADQNRKEIAMDAIQGK